MNKIYENTSRSKQHVRVAKKQTIAALEFSVTIFSLGDQYMVQLFGMVLLAKVNTLTRLGGWSSWHEP